jgi:hypothetical protein
MLNLNSYILSVGYLENKQSWQSYIRSKASSPRLDQLGRQRAMSKSSSKTEPLIYVNLLEDLLQTSNAWTSIRNIIIN